MAFFPPNYLEGCDGMLLCYPYLPTPTPPPLPVKDACFMYGTYLPQSLGRMCVEYHCGTPHEACLQCVTVVPPMKDACSM